jgi:hypothetical protein
VGFRAHPSGGRDKFDPGSIGDLLINRAQHIRLVFEGYCGCWSHFAGIVEGVLLRRKSRLGIFLSAHERIEGDKKERTLTAKAGDGSVIYGRAEAVPFQDRVLTRGALKPVRRSDESIAE